jgi:hypothetical protein
MNLLRVLFTLCATFTLLTTGVGNAFAAAPFQQAVITGTVTALSCNTDASTGVTTFLVTLTRADGSNTTVRIDQETAVALELIYLNEDGSPDCSEEALSEAIGWSVSIDESAIIPDKLVDQHPVGSALATFFQDVTDYETIMTAHEDGFGFGVIAQALWMVRKLEGGNDEVLAILKAKKSGDYSALGFEGIKNWGQFRKAVLEGKTGNLGTVVSENGNGNGNGNNSNNGNHGNGNNGNGNGNGNGNDKDKDKGKGNDKEK